MIAQFLSYSVAVEQFFLILELDYTGCCSLEIMGVLTDRPSMLVDLWACNIKLFGCCYFRLCIFLCREMKFFLVKFRSQI